ncbi:MAG: DUF4091 domain-containing protein [Proteiniphilum sp.]|nr:DUF4091 domain-containing protein [Proteiniphilum sp.]
MTENKDAIAVAKGEAASFQFVVRSTYPITGLKVEAASLSNGNNNIPLDFKAFVGYVDVKPNHFSPIPSKDKIVSVSGFYPDPLLEVETKDVPPSVNQTLWINYKVPRDAVEGTYTADVVITGEKNGMKFCITRQITAKVYPVTLPEQTLFVSNWLNNHLQYLNNNTSVPEEGHKLELYKVIANKMRDYGQNMYMVGRPINDCKFTRNHTGNSNPTTEFTFDFSWFDKKIELFIREGNMKRIEGEHIAYRLSGWYDPFGVQVPYSPTVVIPFDATTRNFLDQFIPALYNHLKEKGWDKIYYQHIADEPGTRESASSYNQIAAYVKQLAPELKIIEATHSTKEVCQSIDVIVPMLDYFHQDYSFYKTQQNAGKELWFYTCMEPVGNYANRFLELPLIQTRILHWINYRYNATGYLHWGLDSWRTFNWETGYVDWGGNLPAGDAWIIYPAYNKVYSSIRLEAMRDGINDYELLKLLESKNPARAKELAEGVVMNFDSYDSRITAFRERRVKLLQWLSE